MAFSLPVIEYGFKTSSGEHEMIKCDSFDVNFIIKYKNSKEQQPKMSRSNDIWMGTMWVTLNLLPVKRCFGGVLSGDKKFCLTLVVKFGLFLQKWTEIVCLFPFHICSNERGCAFYMPSLLHCLLLSSLCLFQKPSLKERQGWKWLWNENIVFYSLGLSLSSLEIRNDVLIPMKVTLADRKKVVKVEFFPSPFLFSCFSCFGFFLCSFVIRLLKSGDPRKKFFFKKNVFVQKRKW